MPPLGGGMEIIMKIACVAYLHGTGGAERQITMLANAMSKKNYEVHLIVLVDNKSKYEIYPEVIVHDLTECEKNTKVRFVSRFFALEKELKAIRPDISVHFWLQSAYFCAMMNKSVCGKVIYSERGDPGDSEYNGILGRIRNLAFKRIDWFVFQSEGARDYFLSKIVERSTVIHNAVSIPENLYTTLPEERKNIILNVGRLHPQKNQKLLIDAFNLIKDQIADYSLHIYGDGELERELNDQIKRLGLEKRVFILPSTKDIYDRMRESSLFVLSSDYEGMPNVLLEAMSLGIPSVSTDCKPGGARTIISQNKNGIIVPLNDKEKLADAMLDVLMHKDKADKLAEQGMLIRKMHSKEHIYDIWDQTLKSLS